MQIKIILTRENIPQPCAVQVYASSYRALVAKSAETVCKYAMQYGVSPLAVDYSVKYA
jgi:hypothetical protein